MLNRRSKNTTVAGEFGITEDALAEIEERVSEHLDREALQIENESHWKELAGQDYGLEQGSKTCRILLAQTVAREIGLRLGPLFVKAACEYAVMLTRTILDHHRARPARRDIHWSAISKRALTFCAVRTDWEYSARWFIGPFKSAGLGWQDASATKQAFLAALSGWMFVGLNAKPALSNDPEFDTVPDLLRREIRHVVRLAAPKGQTIHASDVPSAHDLKYGHGNITQRKAAEFLCRDPRTIRNYIEKGELTKTKDRRIACDDKLFRKLRRARGYAFRVM